MILLISPSKAETTKRFLQEAEKLNIGISNLDVKEFALRNFEVDLNKYESLLVRQAFPYFSHILSLAKAFDLAGKKVVDASLAKNPHLDFSKMGDLETLAAQSIPVPKTFRMGTVRALNYPFILKWNHGFGGKDVFLIENENSINDHMPQHPIDEWLYQEYIDAEWEYKIITVGFKSLPKVLKIKISPNSHRPDFSQVFVLEKDRAAEAVNLAETSARILGKELSKVDILQKGGEYFVLEANRWPGLRIFEEATGYNVAKDFLEYVLGR